MDQREVAVCVDAEKSGGAVAAKVAAEPFDTVVFLSQVKDASAFVTDAAAAFAGLLRRNQSHPPGFVADRQ